jgi:hypothetical protein
LITKLVKRTSAYKQLKTKGYSEQQIMDSLGRKKIMILADGEGEKTVEASTIDSIQHYKSINTIAVKVLKEVSVLNVIRQLMLEMMKSTINYGTASRIRNT